MLGQGSANQFVASLPIWAYLGLMAGALRLVAAALAAMVVGGAALAPARALAVADEPRWQYFPNIPSLDGANTDRRVVGCFPGGASPQAGCDVDERDPPASAPAAVGLRLADADVHDRRAQC